MNRNRGVRYVMAVCFLILSASMLTADGDKSGEVIDRQVISAGGGECASVGYRLTGTVSQSAVGQSASVNHSISHGFWQNGDYPCVGICGDANHDGSVNVSDASYIILFVFTDGPAPRPTLACGDANSDGSSNISDAIYLINYVFIGGNAPTDCAHDLWSGDDCCWFYK